MHRCNFFVPAVLALAALVSLAGVTSAAEAPASPDRISYYKQIRPLFQAKCQGCHQPAKAKGKYVMTAFDQLLKGGSSGDAAIVPGKPDSSALIEMITPIDGEAEMPQKAEPLHETEIALIRKWIEQGAKDDTPENARERYDKDNPPIYTRPPVVTSMDFSPKGDLLAIAGFHEVLLFNTKDWSRAGRLIGVSQRIESVSFSPDGAKLAVAGGLPGRMGEIQVWNVAKQTLDLSLPVTYDTVYGVSWSPDGSKLAFGCADNTIRAVDSKTGKQLVYMAAHNDWVQGTVFSMDNKSVFSVSRDKTVKQTDVATQRFIGNVTTHTPGVLRGGMLAIARHPKRNELLAGGADGAPKLFRMATKAAPAGGGNPNQIREYAALPGRLFDVRFNPDGSRAFAGSSLDNAGQVRAYETDNGKQVWSLPIEGAGVYALAVSPDGKTLAASGGDGRIRLIDAAKGKVVKAFVPVDIAKQGDGAGGTLVADPTESKLAKKETLPAGRKVVSIDVQPSAIAIDKPVDYVQMIVSAKLDTGDVIDITRMGNWKVLGGVGHVSSHGLFTPTKNGNGKLIGELAGQRVETNITVAGIGTKDGSAYTPDFVRDVNPVLSRLGCNAGTCHGAQDGKAGFKLSLRGYDAIGDVRAFTDDHASRRVNVASPDDSLMLMKATGAVPHEGGQLIKPGSRYYNIIRNWIASGAKLNPSSAKVASIDVLPKNPVLQREGDRQTVRVVATYTDGSKRDVTKEAFVTSGDTEIAAVSKDGIMVALRRGESPVLVRYEGAYAATTLTVMGDRTGFSWQQPEVWSKIDELVADKWQRMKIQPSELCTDSEFIRRVYLDLTGLPPTAEQVKAFLADQTPTRQRRDALIDQLVGSKEYIEHWTNKWADLLQVNRKFLGPQGAAAFRNWIRNEVANNTPYDDFARKILTADGSNKDNPAASYYKILRDPADIMENTTHLFLAVRFNCNKCHDHPFERWTQDQYYETAAYFARVGLKTDPASGKARIGGTAVEGAKPLYEIVYEKPNGEITHDRTKKVTPPQFPFEAKFEAKEKETRRQQLAKWITSPDNDYFARSYVNRLWGYLNGVGIMEPIDDLRAGNPPTNPELLAHLTDEFVNSKFNVQHMMKMICKSRTYQLSFRTNKWNEDDKLNFSHRVPKRLNAEVLFDAVHRVTGSTLRIPGVPAGTRAAAIPDSGVKVPGGFLGTFGRPARESACECERSNDVNLGPVMALISGPTIANAIADGGNALVKLAKETKTDEQMINEIYLRILNRPATEREIKVALAEAKGIEQDHAIIAASLAKMEATFADELTKKNAARDAVIAKAKADLNTYRQQIAPQRKKMEDARQSRIAKLTAELKQAEQGLPQRLAQWEKQRAQGITWAVLEPTSMKSTNNAKLVKEKDGSIFVTGPNGKTVTEFIAKTEMKNITGLRLELLADKRLPMNGPGRAQNGNFVLGELEVFAAPLEQAGNAKAFRKLTLQNPQADFAQQSYPIAAVLDGKLAASGNGWATAPQTGKSRTATFEFKENVAVSEGGVALKFVMNQPFQDGKHTIGKFRLSVTNAARPITLDSVGPQLSEWHYVGPFKGGDMNALFNRKFDPEKKVDLKASYVNGTLKWVKKPEWKDAVVHNVFPVENSANYIYRTIKVPAATKAPLSLGSDDGIKVFVNGKQVLANNVGRGAAPDQEKITIDLNAGVNHVLIKVVNGVGSGGFYFRSDLKGVSIPGNVLAALDVPADKRNKQQQAAVMKFYRGVDPLIPSINTRLAAAKKPLPKDAGETQREMSLTNASKPVPIDPDLLELRRIANLSSQQAKNRRLTLAQDLAWVLINSPAFLFNH